MEEGMGWGIGQRLGKVEAQTCAVGEAVGRDRGGCTWASEAGRETAGTRDGKAGTGIFFDHTVGE